MDQQDAPQNERLNPFDSATMRTWLQLALDHAHQDELAYRQRLAAWDHRASNSHDLLDELSAVVQELRDHVQRCTTFTRLFSQAHPNLDPDVHQLLQVLHLHHDRLFMIVNEQLLGRFGATLKQSITNRDDPTRNDTPRSAQ